MLAQIKRVSFELRRDWFLKNLGQINVPDVFEHASTPGCFHSLKAQNFLQILQQIWQHETYRSDVGRQMCGDKERCPLMASPIMAELVERCMKARLGVCRWISPQPAVITQTPRLSGNINTAKCACKFPEDKYVMLVPEKINCDNPPPPLFPPQTLWSLGGAVDSVHTHTHTHTHTHRAWYRDHAFPVV